VFVPAVLVFPNGRYGNNIYDHFIVSHGLPFHGEEPNLSNYHLHDVAFPERERIDCVWKYLNEDSKHRVIVGQAQMEDFIIYCTVVYNEGSDANHHFIWTLIFDFP
jgi:hypothetical protein